MGIVGRDHFMRMHIILPSLGVVAFTIANAQIVVPASPKKFTTRPIGDSGGTGQVEVIPKDAAMPKKRTITYMVLAEGRSWTSNEGKVLEAKLIAFEDVVIDGESTAAPTPPQHPTVMRNGKVRLLAGRKSYELEVSRLSEADREFIEQIRVRFEKKTPPAP